MGYVAFGQTDIGLKRINNQDCYLVHQELNLFAIADGMGGHQKGALAAQMALDIIQEKLEKDPPSNDTAVSKTLALAYEEANQQIFTKASISSDIQYGMGTTLVLAYLFENHLFMANVGDSRLYLMKKGFLWQITEDHSLLNEQIKWGFIDESREEEIENFKHKNVIVRCLGIENHVECDLYKRKVCPGDRFLLCSDGLSNMLSHEEIQEVLSQKETKKAVTQCINLARKKGGSDNITVVIIDFS